MNIGVWMWAVGRISLLYDRQIEGRKSGLDVAVRHNYVNHHVYECLEI